MSLVGMQHAFAWLAMATRKNILANCSLTALDVNANAIVNAGASASASASADVDADADVNAISNARLSVPLSSVRTN